MQKLLKFIGLFLLAGAFSAFIIYGVFSFVFWDMTPKNWSESSRLVFVLLYVLAIYGCLGAAFMYLEKDKEK